VCHFIIIALFHDLSLESIQKKEEKKRKGMMMHLPVLLTNLNDGSYTA